MSNKPYLSEEFRKIAEEVGLLTPNLEYHTKDGTRFYIDRMLEQYSLKLKEQIGVKNA